MGARAAAGGFMKKGFLANIGKSAMINATPLGKGWIELILATNKHKPQRK